MYKRILVAVDGSHTSTEALHEAIRLAGDQHARLCFAYVAEEITLNWDAEFADPAEIWQAQRQAGQKLLDHAAAVAGKCGIQTETRLVEIIKLGQRIPEAIAQTANDWQADLIVVGTHGRRGLSHVFLGSVAEGIVRVANQPVLLVRGK